MKLSVKGRRHLESLLKRVAAIMEDVTNKAEGNGTSSLHPGFLLCTQLCRRHSKKGKFYQETTELYRQASSAW
jgi:hypothetical protein